MLERDAENSYLALDHSDEDPMDQLQGQDEKTPVQRHAAMTWAQRLKRVFNIDVETCRVCGGTAKVIACVEDPVVIKKILMYLEEKSPSRAALL